MSALKSIADALEEIPVRGCYRPKLAILIAGIRSAAEIRHERSVSPEILALGLTRSESRLFSALVPNAIVSKEHLLNALYFDRPGDEPDAKIIDVLVCKIRKKLEEAGSPYSIKTIWGRGFVLRAGA